MMLTERHPEQTSTERARRLDLTAEELAERTQVRPVTRVPHGPTGLWAALADASVRRLRRDLPATLPATRLADLGPAPSMFDIETVPTVRLHAT